MTTMSYRDDLIVVAACLKMGSKSRQLEENKRKKSDTFLDYLRSMSLAELRGRKEENEAAAEASLHFCFLVI
jgi:uncharacterized membrane protein YkvA (DUF1232 family)